MDWEYLREIFWEEYLDLRKDMKEYTKRSLIIYVIIDTVIMMRWAVYAACLWKIINASSGPQSVYPKVFSVWFTLFTSWVAQSLIDWLRNGLPEFDSR
jgi:hypothetical protein